MQKKADICYTASFQVFPLRGGIVVGGGVRFSAIEFGGIRSEMPVVLAVHRPVAEDDCRELTRRMADLHADMVIDQIRNLHCSPQRKRLLLECVIEAKKNGGGENVGRAAAIKN